MLIIEQINGLMNSKRVLALQKEIIEVKNAIELYYKHTELNAYESDSLCRIHGTLLKTPVIRSS